jgi:myosin heavy subunit
LSGSKVGGIPGSPGGAAASPARWSKETWIGLLDIFGFEIFEVNSFEQLCINYANEKLQQIFNAHTFKMEEKLYQVEGVPYANVEFIDNQEVLDLIEQRPHGLLVALDDELRAPRGKQCR